MHRLVSVLTVGILVACGEQALPVAISQAADESTPRVTAGKPMGPVELATLIVPRPCDGGLPFTDGGTPPFHRGSPGGALCWVQVFGERQSDIGEGVAVDSKGNIVVVGSYGGSGWENIAVSFGGDPLPDHGHAIDAWGPDLVVAKYTPTGEHLWSRGFGGSESGAFGTSVAIDADDNIIVGGGYTGSVDFGAGSTPWIGGGNGFVLKISDSGQVLWARPFGAKSASGWTFAVATDGASVYATGYFSGSGWDFGGGPLPPNGEQWNENAFLVMYDSHGNYRWAQRFGGDSGSGRGVSVAVDPDGNAIIGGGLGTQPYGALSPFVAKVSTSGAVEWIKVLTGAKGAHTVIGTRVATTKDGRVVIWGSFTGNFSFASQMFTSTPSPSWLSAPEPDVYLGELSSSGSEIWLRTYGGRGSQNASAIRVARDGDIYVSGYFGGNAAEDNYTGYTPARADLGGGSLENSEDWSIFLARYSGTGDHLWSKTFLGGDMPDGTGSKALSLDVDEQGIVVTGFFQGGISFDGVSHGSKGSLKSDLFLLRLSP